MFTSKNICAFKVLYNNNHILLLYLFSKMISLRKNLFMLKFNSPLKSCVVQVSRCVMDWIWVYLARGVESIMSKLSQQLIQSNLWKEIKGGRVGPGWVLREKMAKSLSGWIEINSLVQKKKTSLGKRLFWRKRDFSIWIEFLSNYISFLIKTEVLLAHENSWSYNKYFMYF